MQGHRNWDRFAKRPTESNLDWEKVYRSFAEVYELLDEHSPSWYTEEIHDRAESALQTLNAQVARQYKWHPIHPIDHSKVWLRGLAVAALVGLGGISYVLHLDKSAAMLLMLIVILLFTRFGRILDSIFLSALSAGVLSYLFLDPVRSFTIENSSDQASLAVFVVAAIAGSYLMKQSKAAE